MVGNLAECEADQLLCHTPAVQPIKPQLINQKAGPKSTAEPQAEGRDEDLELALRESEKLNDANDHSLRKALQLSMEGTIQS